MSATATGCTSASSSFRLCVCSNAFLISGCFSILLGCNRECEDLANGMEVRCFVGIAKIIRC